MWVLFILDIRKNIRIRGYLYPVDHISDPHPLTEISAFKSCPTPFPRSTVLTVSVPGSVADTHREQKWYRNRASHILHRTETYT